MRAVGITQRVTKRPVCCDLSRNVDNIHNRSIDPSLCMLSVFRIKQGMGSMKHQTTATDLLSLAAIDRHRVLTDHPAHLIRRAFQIFLFCFDDAMSGLNLTPVKWIILCTAYNFPDFSVTELARAAVVDKASCGRAATALKKSGLLYVEMGQLDGRQKIIRLTPAGVALVEKGFARVEKLRYLILRELDSEEADQFVRVMTAFVLKSGTQVRPSIPKSSARRAG